MGAGESNGRLQQIGRYEIVARIARGGMAEVFLGRATGEGGFQRLVTIKRILPHLAATEEFVAMFTDEARILAELHHSNIGQVFEFSREGDTYFIAMEYIRGVDLRRIYRKFGKLGVLPPHAMAAFLVRDVCAALEYAHTRQDNRGEPLGIVHRDVSPSNVLVSFEGEIKLIDFGIARATERLHETSGATLKGKFSYMSPEQARGEDLDNRSDIFGCGILLYELLTGRNPFKGKTDLGTLERVRKASIPPPSALVGKIPPELEHVCLRALSLAPADRYADAGELQSELEKYCFEAAYGRRKLAAWMQEKFADQMEQTRRFIGQAEASPMIAPEKPDAPADDTEATKTSLFEGWMESGSGAPPQTGPPRPESGPAAEASGPRPDTTTAHSAGEKTAEATAPDGRSLTRWLVMGVSAAAVVLLALTLLFMGRTDGGTGSADNMEPSMAPAAEALASPPVTEQAAAPAAEPAPPNPDAGPDRSPAQRAAPAPRKRPGRRARPKPAQRPAPKPRPAPPARSSARQEQN